MSFPDLWRNSNHEMAVNGLFQCAEGAFEQKFGPPESSGSNRRPRFAILHEFFAILQPSHRDLSIDTLPAFSALRVPALQGSPLLLEDRDLSSSPTALPLAVTS